MADHSRPLSVRLDEDALSALEVLAGAGMSRSEAIRTALVEAAQRRRPYDLDREIRAVADDPRDRAVKAELTEFMESLADTW